MSSIGSVEDLSAARARVSPLAKTLLGAETRGQVREALGFYLFVSP